MGKAKRRQTGFFAEETAKFMKETIDGTFLIGPIVWLKDGKADEHWRLTTAYCDRSRVTRYNHIKSGEKGILEAARNTVSMALAAAKPCVILDLDDELEMFKFAEAEWPGEDNAKRRKSLEAERAQWAAEAAR
jgi:hypothetical protein